MGTRTTDSGTYNLERHSVPPISRLPDCHRDSTSHRRLGLWDRSDFDDVLRAWWRGSV